MQKCKIEGCNKPISNKQTGLCHKHHLRFVRYGTTELTRNTVEREKECIVEGCHNLQQTRDGYCLKHYKRFKRTGSVELQKNEPKKCKYCDRMAVARGMCNKHYQNWLRHGDAQYTDKIRKGTNKHGYKKSQGKYRVQHRKIAAEMLGRDITPQEVVHHIDMDKLNNNKENLYVCNKNEHSSIHQQLNKVAGELVKCGIIKFKNGKYYSDFSNTTL
jgi:hypothetical protein